MNIEPPDRVAALLNSYYPQAAPNRELLFKHSLDVVSLSLQIGKNFPNARLDFLEEAAWVHDIGICQTRAPGIKCYGEKHYLCHGVIGRAICEQADLKEHGLVCERHVGTGFTAAEAAAIGCGLPVRDMLPVSLEEQIVCYADQFFSKSLPGRLDFEEVRRRVSKHGQAPLDRLEALDMRFGKYAGS